MKIAGMEEKGFSLRMQGMCETIAFFRGRADLTFYPPEKYQVFRAESSGIT
jgi:hypothetical protein